MGGIYFKAIYEQLVIFHATSYDWRVIGGMSGLLGIWVIYLFHSMGAFNALN